METDLLQPSSPVVKIEGGYRPTSNGIPFAGHAAPEHVGNFSHSREGVPDDSLVAWRSFAAASQQTIDRYLEVYMEFIYPLFPLFHGPTMWDRVRRQHYLVDRGFFASIMAACALAAARTRDGATGEKYQSDQGASQSSETFFAAAQDALPKDLSKATGLGYLRAYALLVLSSIQHGRLQAMHQYMGHYMTLSAMQQFHDENKWPVNLTVVEKEERRRLFWCVYTLDIYMSAVFGTISRSQETHSNVQYPSEVDDEDISSDSISSSSDDLHWLRGWNFTTDLYRILEHTLKRLRRNKQNLTDDRTSIVRLLIADNVPDLQVMETMLDLYYALPPRFKDAQSPATGERSHDLIRFQAANVQATLQLVRIVLFESSNWQDLDRKCEVAEQVLTTFSNIPAHYLRAISTPLVYHLGGIGKILASVVQDVLTEEKYQRVRALLGSLADLLEDLESGLQPAAGASKEIRAHIDKIDHFMEAQRQMLASFAQAPHSLENIPEMSMNNGTQNGVDHGHLHLPTNSLGMRTPLDEFQLPGDLTAGWPFPFALTPGDDQQLSGFHDETRA
ncbi:related to C6 transcription factor [Ramularia collo-cygni]|uniref:Related to C6 transcription factor n=1 Tax=Ramularia collo-cygni TaxID=112498 RepID=A0A2D3VEU0_9PEZI|nr:related to C6 transcription factor [Ramularia collo-cygni]CZT23602.1 related to C6 transcription factor [Ramularia collo-cygni]